jgi:Rieske Fe-S protein
MDRQDFLKTCGMACLASIGVASLLQSCTSSQYFAKSELEGEYLKVLLTEFSAERKFVLVRSERLNFPIYLYQVNSTEYSAVWMECTHQGAELSAHGELLTCPAHGSEFDKLGNVMQGPAQSNLRKFKTKTENQHVLIHLS